MGEAEAFPILSKQEGPDMRRMIPLTLALLLLAGCAAESAPTVSAPEPEAEYVPAPTSTPAPEPSSEPTPEPNYWDNPVAGPAKGGYEFRSDKLGLSFTVPAEISEKVGVVEGIDYFDPEGTSLTIYYYPEDGGGAHFLTSIVAVSPRSAFFDQDNWYQGLMTSQNIIAASETSLYFKLGSIGGTDIWRDDPNWDDFIETSKLLSVALEESLQVDEPSGTPALDADTVLDTAIALEARGGTSMTRAEFAQLAFDMLEAENKGEDYSLNYSDVATDDEAAHAIAYLASYGLVSGCTGDEFRPDEAVTRAEFAELTQKLLFESWPEWYGDPIGSTDVDDSHPAHSYLNYAWKNGWLTTDSEGNFRPDEPITDAEAAWALRAIWMQKLRGEVFLPDPGFEVTSWWLSEPFGNGGQALVLGGDSGVFCAYVCLEHTEYSVKTMPAALGSGFEPEGDRARLDLGYLTLKLNRVIWSDAANALGDLPCLPGEVKLPISSYTSREDALRTLGQPLGISEQGGVERWDYGTTVFEFAADGDALSLKSIDSSDARFAPNLREVCLGRLSAANVLSFPRDTERTNGVWRCYGGEDGARAEICSDEDGYILIADESYELRLWLDTENGGSVCRVVYEVF